MANDANKVSFDMSALNLKELIDVYDHINSFLALLEEKRIVQEVKGEDNG